MVYLARPTVVEGKIEGFSASFVVIVGVCELCYLFF